MPSKDAAAQKRGTKRKLAAELRSSPAQEAGVDSDVSVGGFTHCSLCVLLCCGARLRVYDMQRHRSVIYVAFDAFAACQPAWLIRHLYCPCAGAGEGNHPKHQDSM